MKVNYFLNLFLLGEDKRKHGLKVGNRLVQIPDILSYCKISKIIIPRKKPKKNEDLYSQSMAGKNS